MDAAGQDDVEDVAGGVCRPRMRIERLSKVPFVPDGVVGRPPMRKGPDVRGLCTSSDRYQRLAMYIVTSKPKRISVYAGLLHMATSR